MPRSHERSPSPSRHNQRSRSPARRQDNNREDRAKRQRTGFRWKEKSRGEDRSQRNKGLERGYQNRDRARSRSPFRDRDRDRGRDAREGRDSRYDRDGGNNRDQERNRERAPDRKDDTKPKEKKETKKVVSAPGEPMIVVHVNDRLGTKAAIPCLASDPIKLFKAQVAARIGREPHEILLKRQGERPFKDQLTLEDYGVSNGVQLDLEVDTGD
ncbi:hypothetical protein FQN57_002962 [Myotisia sp. PD_48]|nr:hypothetical protein FQN57_002962 [Myotisia sp. PD_48]